MPVFGKIVWIFLICFKVSIALEKHMICKDVSDVFSSSSSSENPLRSTELPSQGRPGKTGARGDVGPPGVQGPQGPPGIVDYQRVKTFANNEIEKELRKISSRLDEVEDYFKRIKNGLCQVEHEGKCYWVIFLKSNYLQAKTLCAQFSAEPANIYSETHYNKIVAYVRRVIPATTSYIEPWLGMTINLSNLQVSLRDGTTTAPYLKWYPSYPSTTAGRTQINLQVRPNTATATQNMWNYDPREVRDGVLCEF